MQTQVLLGASFTLRLTAVALAGVPVNWEEGGACRCGWVSGAGYTGFMMGVMIGVCWEGG